MSTNELVQYQPPLAERIEYSKTVSASALIPQAFRNRPADAFVATEYGHALGLEPIVALSEINVIQGTPSLSASMMAALARQAGHKVRVTGDEKSATCVIVRADDPDHEHTATWTEKKAKDAGLWGKGHWSKDPGTMLRWRAISECVRFACSEVLGGLKYTPEEVAEFKPAPAQRPVAAGRVTASDFTTSAPEPVASAPELPTGEALADMYQAVQLLDGDPVAYLGSVVGREVSGSGDLTAREVEQVTEQAWRDHAAKQDVETLDVEVAS